MLSWPLALLLLVQSVHALDFKKYLTLSTEQGLPGQTVRTIAQDSNGLIWAGIEGIGLAKYNGHDFRLYQHDPENEHSLSNNNVERIFVDSKGRIWVGTMAGLNLYIAEKNAFRRFIASDIDSNTLPGRSIQAIAEDLKGKLWFGTDRGLAYWDEVQNRFVAIRYQEPESRMLKELTSVSDLHVDPFGFLWVSTRSALYKVEPNNGHCLKVQFESREVQSMDPKYFFAVRSDRMENLWIGTDKGLIQYNPSTKQSKCYDLSDGNILSDSSEVSSILVDQRGYVWIGTWNAGLRILDPRSGRMVARYHDTRISNGLQSNFIRAFHEDRNGLIWIAVKFAGLQIYDARREMFRHLQGSPWYQEGLKDQNVYSMEAYGEKVWMGTLHSGAYLYDPENQSFEAYPLQESPEKPLLGRRIESIHVERADLVWFCTDGGIAELNPETGNLRNYPYSICRDLSPIDDKRFLVGTTDGLAILNRETGEIRPIKPSVMEGEPDFPNADSRVFFKDKDGELWIGTYLNGLWKYNASENRITKVQLSTLVNGDASMLTIRTPRFFHQDQDGNLWIGTRLEGLLKVNPTTGLTEVYGVENLLPTQTIFSIIEDQYGCLWLSTNIGIVRFHPKRSQVEVFDVAYGTQGLVFEPRSAARTDDGTILMGGANGTNMFKPDQIKSYSYPAPLVFSSIQINDDEIAKDTPTPKTTHLRHDQNLVSFNFSLLDYSFPGKNRYRYRLHGIDLDWIDAGQGNTARYTSLPPGSYQFEVMGMNPNQPDSNPTNRAVFEFTVASPYWKTAWFRWLIAVAATLMLIALYVNGIQRERAQNRKLERLVQKRTDELQTANVTLQSQSREIEIQNHQLHDHKVHLESTVQERTRELELERDRAEQSDRLKSAFIANMSHEIRTPLNAIMGFSHLIALEAEGRKEYEDYVGRITENSQMLVQLLDDIIDFSIIESGSVTLHPSEFELEAFFASTCQDFSQYVAIRGKPRVRFENHFCVPELQQIVLRTDRFRLKQILSNYLSNACKFTDTGQITFGVELLADQKVHFWIQDTGRGILAEDQDSIYERFHKIVNNDQPFVAGTGLGLSICKSLAEHLGADLTLVSQPGVGSTFGIVLPVFRTDHAPTIEPPEPKRGFSSDQENWDGVTILVAEDTDHNFELIQKYLSETGATIIHARDGEEAVRLFQMANPSPDLLLFDIKMPKLSGIEALARIREINPGIPAIAQTAHALHSEVKEIINNGFDHCITKPIDRRHFMETIASMISCK